MQDCGFKRTNTVREYDKFAIRGDIVDIVSDTSTHPYRIDFFGAELENI